MSARINGKMVTDDEFAEYLIRDVKDAGPFKPGIPFYNIDGNCIEVYWDNDSAYGETVGNVTLMRAQNDKRVVGVVIHRVSRLLEASE